MNIPLSRNDILEPVLRTDALITPISATFLRHKAFSFYDPVKLTKLDIVRLNP